MNAHLVGTSHCVLGADACDLELVSVFRGLGKGDVLRKASLIYRGMAVMDWSSCCKAFQVEIYSSWWDHMAWLASWGESLPSEATSRDPLETCGCLDSDPWKSRTLLLQLLSYMTCPQRYRLFAHIFPEVHFQLNYHPACSCSIRA